MFMPSCCSVSQQASTRSHPVQRLRYQSRQESQRSTELGLQHSCPKPPDQAKLHVTVAFDRLCRAVVAGLGSDGGKIGKIGGGGEVRGGSWAQEQPMVATRGV